LISLAAIFFLCGAPTLGHAQVAAYGTFSVTKAQNLASDNILYGATTGLVLTKLHGIGKFDFGANLQGRFVSAGNFNLDAITFGPRVLLPRLIGLRPYAEFLVGFAHVKSPADQAQASTDSTMQINGGVMKRLTPHLDLVGEYSYSQLYSFGGEYNPKTFSVGGVYYFSRRD
jgi:hypothetical protein